MSRLLSVLLSNNNLSSFQKLILESYWSQRRIRFHLFLNVQNLVTIFSIWIFFIDCIFRSNWRFSIGKAEEDKCLNATFSHNMESEVEVYRSAGWVDFHKSCQATKFQSKSFINMYLAKKKKKEGHLRID